MNPPLDLRGTPCPLNFVRTRLQLEQLPPGTPLEVWLDGGEPIQQVPDSLRQQGYEILTIQPQDDYFILTVKA
ncbi:MAG: sulfurtransferase TusA family protein [Gloeomargarita sp. HHBFW_bins_162]